MDLCCYNYIYNCACNSGLGDKRSHILIDTKILATKKKFKSTFQKYRFIIFNISKLYIYYHIFYLFGIRNREEVHISVETPLCALE